MRFASLFPILVVTALSSAASAPAMARTPAQLLNVEELVTSDDYPSGALRDGLEGTVRVSVRVRRDGLVDTCKVIQSSGHAALDEQSCALFRGRARFEPARDSSGRAIAGTYEKTMRWQIPDKDVPLAPRQAWLMRVILSMSESNIVSCRAETVGLPTAIEICPASPASPRPAGEKILGEMITATQFMPVPFAAATIPPDSTDAVKVAQQASEVTIEADGLVSRCVGMRYSGNASPENDLCKQTTQKLTFERCPRAHPR